MGEDAIDTNTAKMVLARLTSMEQSIEDMDATLDTVRTDVAVLKSQSDHAGDYCPRRVDISRAGNGAQLAQARANSAYQKAEEAIHLTVENRVNLAKLAVVGAGGGGAFGLVVGIIQYLAHLQ